jgi:excisionase family DNA binding protein
MKARELADVLGCAKITTYRLIERGLPHYRIGGMVRFDPQAIADYLETHKVGEL